jgi:hypothetical protein
MQGPVIQWIIAIAQNLAASFIAVLLGIAFARFIQDRIDSNRYGGYSVRVIKTERDEAKHVSELKIKVNRPISVAKAKAILAESADLSVFLKGVVSPYATLFCDLIAELEDKEKPAADKVLRLEGKTYVIDLDNNTPPKSPGHKDVLEALNRLSATFGHDAVWTPGYQAARAGETMASSSANSDRERAF